LSRVFGPLLSAAASQLGSLLDRSGSEVTATRIRQAGWFRGVDGPDVIHLYRLAQLKSVSLGMVLGCIVGLALNMSYVAVIALAGLGTTIGMSRHRGRLERAIDERRELMRIEIYTVNQLLAMRVRAGGGVIQAVQATASRGRGEVMSELRDALRLHRAGWSAGDALRRIAELTPEPFCGRTYRLLASAEERGADLAGALLELAEDVRESRRESIKRSATKRRAAMLVPTIAVLAPVLILFVAAPLPYLITGWN
jgi:tight adherence protein C